MKVKFSRKVLGSLRQQLAGIALLAAVAAPAAAAPVVYMTGNNPWSNTANDTAMNAAFGVSNWSKFSSFTMSAFAADTRFLFIDGSDSNANEFSGFLSANLPAIQNYVAGGGSIFLNAAPNEGGSFAMGFGVTLTYPDFAGASQANATAAGLATGIFTGISSSYTGGGFSHASVAGPGLTHFLLDGAGRSVFSGLHFGSGYAAFGGMTLPIFHSPNGDANTLRARMLNFVAEQGEPAAEVPEPASIFLLGVGLLGAVAASRRKRKQ